MFLRETLTYCPFCPDGGEPMWVHGDGKHWSKCFTCNLETPKFDTPAEADAFWNGRYVPPRTCKECGSPIVMVGQWGCDCAMSKDTEERMCLDDEPPAPCIEPADYGWTESGFKARQAAKDFTS